MALVTISGEAKISDSGTAVTIWEDFIVEYKDGNKFERKRKWVIWFNTQVSSFETGDWIEVAGELGTKLETYEKDGETKSAVGHSINDPRVLQVKPKTVTKSVDLDDLSKYGNMPF